MNQFQIPAEEISSITSFMGDADYPGRGQVKFTVGTNNCAIIEIGHRIVTVQFRDQKIATIWENDIVVKRYFPTLLAVLIEVIASETLLSMDWDPYCSFGGPGLCNKINCTEDKCLKSHTDGKERCVGGWNCTVQCCKYYHPISREIDFRPLATPIATNPFLVAKPTPNPFLAQNNPFLVQPNPFLVPVQQLPALIVQEVVSTQQPSAPQEVVSTQQPPAPQEELSKTKRCNCHDQSCTLEHNDCRYGSQCRGIGGKCPFRHPVDAVSRDCQFGSKCRGIGGKCPFQHPIESKSCRCVDDNCTKHLQMPICKNGIGCTRPGCIFRHIE